MESDRINHKVNHHAAPLPLLLAWLHGRPHSFPNINFSASIAQILSWGRIIKEENEVKGYQRRVKVSLHIPIVCTLLSEQESKM